ncbi:MAG TPA: M28 family peptidase [Thermoanaerobaculales bacterium]|nr:M28 family peptidase [Thermoanaerobaculales bacterium]HQL29561.1 M28 family peptidase [Thermoanaerobaculales bacterium]HQN97378.1 M28 family peptidase [Thermoanaerobaculales bacterium]HQP43759.1 M28 family peptidase [Thermoanaerobaculales bacterium]
MGNLIRTKLTRVAAVLGVLAAMIAGGCRQPETAPEARAVGVTLPAGAAEAADTIAAADLLRDVTELASDAMEGRLPGSPGDARARAYLAARLGELGLEPAFGADGWEQPITMVGLTSRLPEVWSFRAPGGGEVAFRLGDEYTGASGVQQPRVSIEGAEVVFVGYGIQAPEEGWDDFKGAELAGKVLLMLNDDPDWDPALFAGARKLSYGRWTYKYESAARQGAAAAIIIHTTPSAGYPWQVVRTGWSGEQFELAAGGEPRTLLKSWLAEDAARRLVALAGHDLDELVASAHSPGFVPVPLGVTTSLRFAVEMRKTATANVGGLLRGSDPELAGELVVVSAHHDHFGIGEPDATGDAIYNGALDNGVAMAQELGVARAFTALPEPPRRSVLFLFPAAEEQGILGSAYFVASGAFPPGRIAADINFELGNVWGLTRDVTVFGKGKSELDDLLAVLAAGQGRVLVEEPDVRAGWFYRSDQISFARAGVPAIWFKSGTDVIGRPAGWGEQQQAEWIERRYHQPSDQVDPSWDLDGLVQDARLAFQLAAVVATRDAMPAWVPGDEFEDERLASLR